VRGNRYSVPAELVAQTVAVRISLDDTLRVYHTETLVASHTLRKAQEGWVTILEHLTQLWQTMLDVERRSLEAYE
jgi:hypothetical protein